MMSPILLVEDEPSIMNLISVNLRGRGYSVLEARNGRQALDYLDDRNFEMMILDIKLPNISGWEILNHLNDDQTPAFPVILMTAGVVDVDLVFRQYQCVENVFIKPFDMNRLIACVQMVLAKN